MPLNKITSVSNPKVKQLVKLRDRKTRDECNLSILEGERELSNALASKVKLEEIYITEDVDQSTLFDELDIPIYEVTKSVFEKISYGSKSSGILATFHPQLANFKSISLRKNPLVVVIEQVEKPGNFGAILRTCDGAGVDCVIICDGKTDVFNPNVIRASVGTVFSVPVIVASNEEAKRFLETNYIQICSTTPSAKKNYNEINLSKSVAIVFGSEDKGLSSYWIDCADLTLKIPMKGQADSLNVSTSTAIVVYEALRQRR